MNTTTVNFYHYISHLPWKWCHDMETSIFLIIFTCLCLTKALLIWIITVFHKALQTLHHVLSWTEHAITNLSNGKIIIFSTKHFTFRQLDANIQTYSKTLSCFVSSSNMSHFLFIYFWMSKTLRKKFPLFNPCANTTRLVIDW